MSGKDKGLLRLTMRRKIIVTGAAMPALAWAGAVRAQTPAKVRRIGLLSPWTASYTASWNQVFQRALRDLGWIEGKNISIEYRYADGKIERLAELTDDLVRLKVDVIVTTVTTDTLVAKNTTRTIPIVMASVSDPVTSGLIESLARPGGNITGLSNMSLELAGKRLELLKEMVPKLSRVAVLWNPQGSSSSIPWKEHQLPAQKLGVQLHSMEVRSPTDFDLAFEAAIRARVGALAIMPNPVITANLKRIADLAAKNRLPSIFQYSEFADAGGLVTYGPDRADMYRRAATYVDKIFRGAKPGDLPVELPTKFEMVINLKTAKALGLTIPPVVMVRATRVIE